MTDWEWRTTQKIDREGKPVGQPVRQRVALSSREVERRAKQRARWDAAQAHFDELESENAALRARLAKLGAATSKPAGAGASSPADPDAEYRAHLLRHVREENARGVLRAEGVGRPAPAPDPERERKAKVARGVARLRTAAGMEPPEETTETDPTDEGEGKKKKPKGDEDEGKGEGEPEGEPTDEAPLDPEQERAAAARRGLERLRVRAGLHSSRRTSRR